MKKGLSVVMSRIATPARVGRRDFIVVVALAAIAFFIPYVAGTYQQEVGFRILQLGALAAAWNIAAGYTGLVSLGSAGFFGIGVYTMAMASNAGLPIVLCVVLAAVLASIFAIIVSPALFRLRGLYFTVGTLALAEALRIFVVNSPWFGGQAGIYLTAKAFTAYDLYWIGLIVAVVIAVCVLFLLRSRWSYRMQAVRDDEDVASQLGVRTYRTKLWAFGLSGALIAVVGSIQALNQGIVQPNSGFGMGWTIEIVSVAIIGGMGTKVGPWIGAIFIVLLGEYLIQFPEIHLAVVGVVLLLVIRFMPNGIWGTLTLALQKDRNFS
ncbi:branched-chain amino acid ABC transporter permease [Salinibacterium sp. NK8237]|uniref:branched-chain amino acid ABC transporter permease n=1 Tax=Salinibacterium sp. NK8237 TaxID=2792038 RepID=UPI0018CDFFFD|nr:branched-chain amino acid ABC transporter permease [Salinibacterium sp. NK8237]MBH0130747.1 branched-chain amino acid ABC transporter permease [Salinibacterium sp. NK8237]